MKIENSRLKMSGGCEASGRIKAELVKMCLSPSSVLQKWNATGSGEGGVLGMPVGTGGRVCGGWCQ